MNSCKALGDVLYLKVIGNYCIKQTFARETFTYSTSHSLCVNTIECFFFTKQTKLAIMAILASQVSSVKTKQSSNKMLPQKALNHHTSSAFFVRFQYNISSLNE